MLQKHGRMLDTTERRLVFFCWCFLALLIHATLALFTQRYHECVSGQWWNYVNQLINNNFYMALTTVNTTDIK